MSFEIGDVVDVFDKDEPQLFPKGNMRGTITRYHQSKGWYWVKHATDFYSVPVRWDMMTLIKR
jgi:hypothetical protein